MMNASALYEPPFSDLHGKGPGGVFVGKTEVIGSIFDRIKAVTSNLRMQA